MNDFVVKQNQCLILMNYIHVDLNGVIPKLTFKDSMSL